MIAKYNGQYFCIDLSVKPIELWKYDKVEGFEKCIDGGLVYYRKFVEQNEIEEIFEVGFSVCWDGQWCGIYYNAENELLSVHTNDREFAYSHGMTELERGAYSCAKSASCFEEYRLWTKKLNSNEDVYNILSYDNFKTLWREMVSDLVPPRI